jgi:Hemopexin
MYDYFFAGTEFVRVNRFDDAADTTSPDYPQPISTWKWGTFGAAGIDAAVWRGAQCYFFAGTEYIEVRRGASEPGTMQGTPKPISELSWNGFGAKGVDAILNSGSKLYVFAGTKYIQVDLGNGGLGTVDPGFPKAISDWGWPAGFGATGIDAALWSGSNCFFFKGNEYVRVSRGEIGTGVVDPGYPQNVSNWKWPSGFGAHGISAALNSGGPMAPTPKAGLGSDINYVVCAPAGDNLLGVTTTLRVTEDIVSPQSWGIQLNGYSPSPSLSAWQQYVLFADPETGYLCAAVNFWSGERVDLLDEIDSLVKLTDYVVPAGWVLSIALQTDADDNVISAIYTVDDATGKQLANHQITLLDLKRNDNRKPVTTEVLAPIVAYSYLVVGPWGGIAASMTSGAGVITYTSSNAMTMKATEPSNVEFPVGSGETANTVYSQVPSAASTEITQYFGLAPVGAAAIKPPGDTLDFPELSPKRGR